MPHVGQPHQEGVLFGVVNLFGRVIEHAHGYRAERAEVVAAVLSGPTVRSTTDRALIAAAFAGSLQVDAWDEDPAIHRIGDIRWAMVLELKRLTDAAG